jgi:hypothetical protein
MSRTCEIQVLTCNVQRASVSRTRRQAAWLADGDADVLVLTEVSAGESGDVLAQLLEDEGFGVLLPKPSENDRYRVLVAGRGVELTGVDVGAGPMGHRCVAARVACLRARSELLASMCPREARQLAATRINALSKIVSRPYCQLLKRRWTCLDLP